MIVRKGARNIAGSSGHSADGPDRTSIKTAAAVGISALVVAAAVNQHLANKAEQANPPAGNFLTLTGSAFITLNKELAARSCCCTAMAA